MAFGSQVPDKTLLRSVNQKLMQKAAGSGSKINATIQGGTVTLSGALAQEHQRKSILACVNGVTGVRRVVDTMTVVPPRKRT
jgi:osmotically-inducible protein OsmY